MPLRGGGVGMCRPASARWPKTAKTGISGRCRTEGQQALAGCWSFPAVNSDAELTALADLAHKARQADALYRSGAGGGSRWLPLS
jgi:hypothetical protein